MTKLILKASDMDGYLTREDLENIKWMDAKYSEVNGILKSLHEQNITKVNERAIELFAEIGEKMGNILKNEPRIHVYSFETPSFIHGEVSRLIAKLRNIDTLAPEFVYYIQRAYELLFNLAFGGAQKNKHYIMVKTPVTMPDDNFAIHKIPLIDEDTTSSVMCVMLRAALLPSMIVSKEIEEYSTKSYVTPFALFKISRNELNKEEKLSYVLDLRKSFFDLEALDNKDWIFADPMNATGGSLITIVKFLLDQGVQPRSIKLFNVMSAMPGSFKIIRAFENAEIYTLWMDPSLNSKSYILPGIGDAGDRINGKDEDEHPRNMLQLIADYGSRITSLYRSQIREIEHTILES